MLSHLLTDKELDFVLELLQEESSKLLKETRHIDSRDMRHDVRERMRTADRLIERLNQMKAGELST